MKKNLIKIKCKKKEDKAETRIYPFGTPVLIPANTSISRINATAFIIGNRGNSHHLCYLTNDSYVSFGGPRFRMVRNDQILTHVYVIPDMIDIDKLCADIIRDLPDQWPEE